MDTSTGRATLKALAWYGNQLSPSYSEFFFLLSGFSSHRYRQDGKGNSTITQNVRFETYGYRWYFHLTSPSSTLTTTIARVVFLKQHPSLDIAMIHETQDVRVAHAYPWYHGSVLDEGAILPEQCDGVAYKLKRFQRTRWKCDVQTNWRGAKGVRPSIFRSTDRSFSAMLGISFHQPTFSESF